MTAKSEQEMRGRNGRMLVYRWAPAAAPRFVAVLVHGYAEHAGRYEHVAQALIDRGAVVYAADHLGHGRSDGERALVSDLDEIVADTDVVVAAARERHADLPIALIGHSMGGIVATRYAQQHARDLAALVLSGPAIGENPSLLALAGMPEIPEIPLDPDSLSRDPEVGRRYAEDPLVYRGPFKRPTLEAFLSAVDRIARGGNFGVLPTFWMHGTDDYLCPLPQTREAIERVRGSDFEERIYAGARHEVFNETNGDEVIGDMLAFLERALAARPRN